MKLRGGTTETEKVALPSHIVTVSERTYPIKLRRLVELKIRRRRYGVVIPAQNCFYNELVRRAWSLIALLEAPAPNYQRGSVP